MTTKLITIELENITRLGYGFAQIFTDFLTLTTSAFSKDEDRYMETMNRYRNDGDHGQRPADYFANALAELMKANQHEAYDYLGDIFTDRVSHGNNGQFFTPTSICDLLAEITIPDTLADDQSVCDPACGSGRILLSAIRKNRFATFYGVDVDRRCVDMAAINILFRNANAYIIWANTLTLETWGGYAIRRTPIGGTLHTLTQEQAKSFMVVEKIANQQANIDTTNTMNAEQLILL